MKLYPRCAASSPAGIRWMMSENSLLDLFPATRNVSKASFSQYTDRYRTTHKQKESHDEQKPGQPVREVGCDAASPRPRQSPPLQIEKIVGGRGAERPRGIPTRD